MEITSSLLRYEDRRWVYYQNKMPCDMFVRKNGWTTKLFKRRCPWCLVCHRLKKNVKENCSFVVVVCLFCFVVVFVFCFFFLLSPFLALSRESLYHQLGSPMTSRHMQCALPGAHNTVYLTSFLVVLIFQ